MKNVFLLYAKKAGQEWSSIPFAYVHLKAAFMSQTVSETNPVFSERLYELSRIDSLKQLLVDCVRENGVFYRTKTFIDIIDNPMILPKSTGTAFPIWRPRTLYVMVSPFLVNL